MCALNTVYRIQKAVKLYFVEQILIILKCYTILALLFCEEAAEIKEKSWLLLDLMITNYVAVVAARDRKKRINFFFFLILYLRKIKFPRCKEELLVAKT